MVGLCVFGKVANVLNMFFLPNFVGFLGGAYSCYFGLEGLG